MNSVVSEGQHIKCVRAIQENAKHNAKHWVCGWCFFWSNLEDSSTHVRYGNNDTEVSTQGHTVDALPQSGEEGRGYLRKASGRGKHPMIRRYPNGATQRESCLVILFTRKLTRRIETS